MIMRYHEYDYDYSNELITYADCFLSNCSFFWRGGGLPFPLVIWILQMIISFHSQNDCRCSSTWIPKKCICISIYVYNYIYIYVCVYLFMIIYVYVTYLAGAFICPYPPWNYCSLGDHHHISGDWSKAYAKRCKTVWNHQPVSSTTLWIILAK